MNHAENIGNLFIGGVPADSRSHKMTAHLEKHDTERDKMHLDGEDFPYLRLALVDKHFEDKDLMLS